jgi:transglutaminase superfamily protein
MQELAAPYWLALRMAGWLCVLPLLLRVRTLPVLLGSIDAQRKLEGGRRPDLDRVVAVAVRVAHLRVFRSPLFPRICMRQSMILYRTLTRLGFPAVIHFGVHKKAAKFWGHSWVTVNGLPLAEPYPAGVFAEVYSYPIRTNRE